MRRFGRTAALTLQSLALMLSGCGDGGGSGGSSPTPTPTSTPTPTPSANASCTLRARQDWALAQMQEWYLFPETLPGNLNPAAYASLEDYVDALTATARAQGRDRYFTFVTSIAGETNYYNNGTTAGFGIRVKTDAGARRAWVSEAFEGAPGLAAGLDRGVEILAIGTGANTLQSVATLMANSGEAGVINALGPDTAGVTRTLRIRDTGGDHVITVSKADYDLTPVSSRYGARVIDDNGNKVGYINLRTFISSADPALRAAFASFKAQGIDQVIIDLRYNGGGLLSIAQTLGNLLGGNRQASDVFAQLTLRPEKSSENETLNFAPQPDSISPRKIAFIGFEGTASASELVINAMVPYLHTNVVLVGGNTYGKPVGQIAIDRSACDDRFRIIAFATKNAAGNGNYFNGLATTMEATCRASDDVTRQFGDAQEGSTRVALDYLAGRGCSPISASGVVAQSVTTSAGSTSGARLLVPDHPTTPQREVPGIF
ncbi:S41 family peptidase [Sphingobium nicotianae]|uniref:Peptidase S41 n=1 Tax=Sphingobium nicotianae TaxID=2782607 RepID=A0A9X1IQT7_9SPHN|nr:S41 family peptidase [Sphingobium nicotianae]MBT2186735.1 peptidase S41 [Sphingobium nicotianae]